VRVAFYAPLKSPTHGTPSGDRRVAGLLIDALQECGHRVEMVSTFRSLDRDGDATRQAALRDQGIALAAQLAAQWQAGPPIGRPDLWFTYHLYYKAPDWLGPRLSRLLNIPYVIAEASYAAKRAGGPWAMGHRSCADAIRQAALVLCPSRDDIDPIERLLGSGERVVHLPPFLEPSPYRAARDARDVHRTNLARQHRVDPDYPWILAAAMMRPGDKLASYRELAATLAHLREERWTLLVAGDGPARDEVEAVLEAAVPGRIRWLGELDAAALASTYGACDLLLWPAVNEAYGMALLEAQAAALPVVSCGARGVPDVVLHQRTGLLVAGGDTRALAEATRGLLHDRVRRQQLGAEAAQFVATERSTAVASSHLGDCLARVLAAQGRPVDGR